jgi:hypothetical protein
MNLLLLLSALLSALTGIGGSVRAPDMAQAVAGQAMVAKAAVVRRTAPTARPANKVAPAMSAVVPGAIWSLSPIRPIWASRRRE